MVNPEIRCEAEISMLKHSPLEHVRTVLPIPAPMMLRSLVLGSEMAELQLQVPAGTATVSPVTAALMAV
jgi:hypothetical protein